MPVTFSVKNVPDDVAQGLRMLADRNHRSLQRELLRILTDAAGTGGVAEPRPAPYRTGRPAAERGLARGARGRLTLPQLWERARRLGGPVPGESSTSLIRRDRDERGSR